MRTRYRDRTSTTWAAFPATAASLCAAASAAPNVSKAPISTNAWRPSRRTTPASSAWRTGGVGVAAGATSATSACGGAASGAASMVSARGLVGSPSVGSSSQSTRRGESGCGATTLSAASGCATAGTGAAGLGKGAGGISGAGGGTTSGAVTAAGMDGSFNHCTVASGSAQRRVGCSRGGAGTAATVRRGCSLAGTVALGAGVAAAADGGAGLRTVGSAAGRSASATGALCATLRARRCGPIARCCSASIPRARLRFSANIGSLGACRTARCMAATAPSRSPSSSFVRPMPLNAHARSRSDACSRVSVSCMKLRRADSNCPPSNVARPCQSSAWWRSSGLSANAKAPRYHCAASSERRFLKATSPRPICASKDSGETSRRRR